MSEIAGKIRAALADHGIVGNLADLHSWRCEYPQQYGQCEHVEHLIADLAAIATPEPAEPEPVAEQPARRLVDRRNPGCVEAWPGCASFEYDPRCCRFPKSCSAGGFVLVDTEPDEQPPVGSD